MKRTSTPEPWPAPIPTVGDEDRVAASIKRLRRPEERVYARALLNWWNAAPMPQRLSDKEAHRIYLRMRRLIRERERYWAELNARAAERAQGAAR